MSVGTTTVRGPVHTGSGFGWGWDDGRWWLLVFLLVLWGSHAALATAIGHRASEAFGVPSMGLSYGDLRVILAGAGR